MCSRWQKTIGGPSPTPLRQLHQTASPAASPASQRRGEKPPPPLPDHPRTAEVWLVLIHGRLSPPDWETALPTVPGVRHSRPYRPIPLQLHNLSHRPVPCRPLDATSGVGKLPSIRALLRPPPGPAPTPSGTSSRTLPRAAELSLRRTLLFSMHFQASSENQLFLKEEPAKNI